MATKRISLGGYDYQFVDTVPDVFICNICYLPSRDPYLSVCCGHVFCNACLNNEFATIKVCPTCRNEEFTTFPNKQADREVKNFRVLCPNKKKGCEWIGELRAVSEHVESSEGCKYVNVVCRNGCGKKILRKNLPHHLLISCPSREEECKHCCTIGGYQYITGRHKKVCPKLPLPCPNKCKADKINREDMADHKKSCPLEMIQCDYGCDFKVTRKDQEKHDQEKMQDHLALTKEELESTRDRVNVLEALLFQIINRQQGSHGITSEWSIQLHLASVSAVTSPVAPVVISLKGYSVKRREKKKWYSNDIYTHNQGYRICLCVRAASNDEKDDRLSVYICLRKGPYDEQLAWPFRDEVEIQLLNQISDEHHICKAISFDNDSEAGNRIMHDGVGDGYGYRSFVLNKTLLKTTLASQYLKDDCLYFKVNYSS